MAEPEKATGAEARSDKSEKPFRPAQWFLVLCVGLGAFLFWHYRTPPHIDPARESEINRARALAFRELSSVVVETGERATHVAWSPDGRRVAVFIAPPPPPPLRRGVGVVSQAEAAGRAKAPREARLQVWQRPNDPGGEWSLAGEVPLGNFRATGLAFSPDGAELTLCGEATSPHGRGTASPLLESGVGLKRWETSALKELPPVPGGEGMGGRVLSVAYRPDGWQMAALTSDRVIFWAKEGLFWRQAGFAPIIRGGGLDPEGSCPLRYSPDGRLLAAAGGEGGVDFWDAATLAPLEPLRVGSDYVADIAWADAGSLLVAAGGLVEKYDLASRVSLGRLALKTGSGVTSVAAAGGQSPQVAGGALSGMGVWDAATGRELQSGMRDYAVTALVFSPDGSLLAGAVRKVGQRTIRLQVWDAASGKTLFTPPDGGQRIGMGAEGK